MKRKKTKNEQIDRLFHIIILLILIIFLLIFKLFKWDIANFMYTFIFLEIIIPTPTIYTKKRFRRMGEMIEILQIPIEEMREVVQAGRYDLIAWEKDKVCITRKQRYQLEEYLETKYLLTFGQAYDEKNKSIKSHQTIENTHEKEVGTEMFNSEK